MTALAYRPGDVLRRTDWLGLDHDEGSPERVAVRVGDRHHDPPGPGRDRREPGRTGAEEGIARERGQQDREEPHQGPGPAGVVPRALVRGHGLG